MPTVPSFPVVIVVLDISVRRVVDDASGAGGVVDLCPAISKGITVMSAVLSYLASKSNDG
jgi:hypothetical protein